MNTQDYQETCRLAQLAALKGKFEEAVTLFDQAMELTQDRYAWIGLSLERKAAFERIPVPMLPRVWGWFVPRKVTR